MAAYNNLGEKMNEQESDPCIAAQVRMSKGVNIRKKRLIIAGAMLLLLLLLILAIILIVYFILNNNDSSSSDSNNVANVGKKSKVPPIDATDCRDLADVNEMDNGVYLVRPNSKLSFDVYCDMTVDDRGGWTVIQRRADMRLRFWNQSWNEYKNGFGNDMNQGSFWLGLDKIFALVDKDVSQGRTITLRIDIWGDRCDQRGRCSNLADGYWFGEWGFAIANETDNYRLKLTISKKGNLTEQSIYDVFYYMNHDQPFTTADRDNSRAGFNCATFRQFGAWWHRDCTHVALNGDFEETTGRAKGLFWFYRNGIVTYNINPKKAEMKIRVDDRKT